MSNKLGIAGVVVGIIGLVPWVLDMAGIDTSGALAPYVPVMLDVWRVISPFAILFGGGAIGWIIRDRSKTRDAETAARIRREDEEHAEKMRREREEHEEKKRREQEERAKAEAARVKHEAAAERQLQWERNMVKKFKEGSPSMKQEIVDMLENGHVEMREDSLAYLNLYDWVEYDTIGTNWPDHNVMISAYLTDEARSVLERNPEILAFARNER